MEHENEELALGETNNNSKMETSKPLIKMALETSQEKRQRKYSLWIMYFTTFIQSVGFSIVLTGVWPYLEQLEKEPNKALLGWVIAANPIGQLIFSPLIGWLCTLVKSIRIPSILCLIVFICSNLWYALLPLHTSHAQYFMMTARFLVGVSSGSITACKTFVTQGTLLGERTAAISYLALFQAVGFTLGPAVQVVLTPLGEKGVPLFGSLSLSMYTAAGWTALIFGIINLVLFHPKLFHESNIAVKEHEMSRKTTTGEQIYKKQDFNWSDLKPDYIAIGAVSISFFIVLFNFSLLETLGTPAVMDQFGWSRTEAVRNFGIVMTISSTFSVLFFCSVGPLCRRFDERNILIFLGMIPMLLGRVFFFGFSGPVAPMRKHGCFIGETVSYSPDECLQKNSTWQVVENGCPEEQTWCFETPALNRVLVCIGLAVGTMGYPYCVALLQTIYSKALGPRPQGTWNGALTAVVSMAKIVGSILLVYLYKNYGVNITSTVVTVLMALSLLLITCVYRRLIPFQMPEAYR